MNAFDVAAQTEVRPGGKCSVGKAIREMTPDQVTELDDALGKHTSPLIAKVLKQWGYQVSEHSVQRHKRHACQCDERNGS